MIKFFFILLTKDKLLMEEMKVSELLYHMLKVLVRGHRGSSLSRIHDVVGSNGQNAKGNSLFAAALSAMLLSIVCHKGVEKKEGP